MLYTHSNKNIDKIQKSTQKKKSNYTVTLVLQSLGMNFFCLLQL